MDCRLIIDGHAPGTWNMAMDEALLQSAGRAGQGGCLRFYLWEQPTLSLGYFQEHKDRARHEASVACPIVRRSTGGGAIVHDRELTYSFTCHASRRDKLDSLSLYDAFHTTLVDELAALGISASLCVATIQPRDRVEPFLCFERRSRGDVLIDDAKIAGSAQRRHKKALLQHGSVLLQKSVAAPELKGISDFAGISIQPGEIASRWASRVGQRLGLSLKPANPTSEEYESADRLAGERYANQHWTCRK